MKQQWKPPELEEMPVVILSLHQSRKQKQGVWLGNNSRERISTNSDAGRTGNEACAAVVAVYEVKDMDQIQRDKIAAKLKKIKALAERGVGGEKETAMRMYEDLKARYELEDEEIMLDAVTLHWFGYADELEERVLRWIFYKVTGDASYHIYTGKYSRRKKRGCDCTEIEAAEITLLYNFYKEELKRELEAFLVAFRWGNDLFPDETARCYKKDDAEAPERTDEEKRMLKKAAWYSNLMDKRKPPTALIGEPEEED